MAIKQAKVSSVNPARMRARVTYEDRNGVVSAELPILCQGSSKNKHYWLPDVGEQVAVAEADEGGGQGFILGSFYSDAMPPEESSQDIRKIKFSDGSYIEHNRATGCLNIVCTGDVTINGRTINLN